MTLCAGKTAYRVRGRSYSSCTIRLSQPLLSQRPYSDTVNTLLHEMIHAYLHVTEGLNYRDSHGPEFRKHMKRINNLQGSKITIYHNFQREVDKFRIHVYRCDGPCITKRPYYGILRRAIERPPGPTDRWWARHKQECGGTFHKIEGPGAIPNAGLKPKVEPKQLIRPKDSSSLDSPNHKYQDSDKCKTRTDRNKGMQSLESSFLRKGVKQSFSSFSKDSFNEAQILQKIKAKYSNIKQAVLLSKEETENAYRVCQKNRSKRGKSPEIGTLVDGKVNPNYIPKSSHNLNLGKYLNRYLQAKKLLHHVPYKPEVLNMKSRTTVPNINIQKYMNRLHEAKKIKTHIPKPDHKSSGHVVACTASSDISEKRLTESLRKGNKRDELSFTVCPICSISVAATAYEQHLQECFGDDLDTEMDMSFEEEGQTGKYNCHEKCITEETSEVESEWNQLEAKNCPNCGCLVLVAEMKLHLQYCIDSEDDDVEIESQSKTPDKNQKTGLLDSYHEVSNVVTCPSCMEKVTENFIQEHLNECLKLLSEEL